MTVGPPPGWTVATGLRLGPTFSHGLKGTYRPWFRSMAHLVQTQYRQLTM